MLFRSLAQTVASETPLKEIESAAESFARGAPAPAWADVLAPQIPAQPGRKPLVVLTPKSLLRLPAAGSPIADLAARTTRKSLRARMRPPAFREIQFPKMQCKSAAARTR